MPQYNVQAAVDAKHKMLLLFETRTDVNDKHHLKYVNEQLGKIYGELPQVCRADSDYFNLSSIPELEEKGMKVYCAITRAAGRKVVKDDNGETIEFSYDEKTDQYICSKGKPLKRMHQLMSHGKRAIKYQGTECQTCSLMARCTTSPKGRVVYKYDNEPWKEGYKQRMSSAMGKAQLRQRRIEVEHPFGTIKLWMGKNSLKLRGTYKVQTEISIYHMAYNFKRLINIEAEAFDYLMERIEKFDWKNEKKQPLAA